MNRISEIYEGKVVTPTSQSVHQERIHWMCNQVEGQRIIDIGCSQGITSILLSRRGLQVLGIDINEDAIEYANRARSKETTKTQQNVTFLNRSLYDASLPMGAFDTAIMGEILEHLASPELAINRVHELLADQGKLVLTVPFGLRYGIQQKHVFYFVSMYRLLYPCMTILNVDMIGGWMCVTCQKGASILTSQPNHIGLSLMEKQEAEFLHREKQAWTTSPLKQPSKLKRVAQGLIGRTRHFVRWLTKGDRWPWEHMNDSAEGRCRLLGK